MRKLILFLIFVSLCSIKSWAQFAVATPSALSYKYSYVATSGTTVIKNSKGFLHNLVLEGGTIGLITIYDNMTTATGNIIASFDSTSTIFSYNIDVNFASGCTILSNGQPTGQSTKYTVSYL